MSSQPTPKTVTYHLPNGTGILLKMIPNSDNRSGYSIICDLCQTQFVYYSNGSLDNITRHRGQHRCRTRADQQRRETEAAVERERLEADGSVDQEVGVNHDVTFPEESVPESEPYSTSDWEPLSDESESESGCDEVESSYHTSFSDICTGVVVQWSHPVSTHYPFHLHCDTSGITIDWNPIAFRDNDQELIMRSTLCYAFRAQLSKSDLDQFSMKACPACRSIPNSPQFLKFRERANYALPHTPWKYLNHAQIIVHLRHIQAENMKYRLENLNLRRRIVTLEAKIEDHQRLLVLISSKNITGLRHLLSTQLKHKSGIKSIVTSLEHAAGEVGELHGQWTTRQLDLAYLAKALGGPKLLYALSKAEGYPSKRTLSKHRQPISICGSLKRPSNDDFEYNLVNVLGQLSISGGKGPKQLMVDDVALDERVRWESNRDVVLGYCREHSDKFDLKPKDQYSMEVLKNARIEGDLHHAKEATIVAIAPVANMLHYYPIPLILSGTCKAETGQQLANWISQFVEFYHNHEQGEQLHGPIFSFASDGASSFRLARFLLFMKHAVEPDSPLGKILYPLDGLNCFTGPYGILGTCDFKHVIKRFATLLRRMAGIKVGDVTIMPSHVESELQLFMSAADASTLLDPADKQDVPKAVRLIQVLLKLDKESATKDPSIVVRRNALIFIAKTLYCFVEPFTRVVSSISEQIRSLSTYAHITAAMYHTYGPTFIPGALYADSHAIVKNIIFTVARLQLSEAPATDSQYFAPHDGTDRLENLFSHLRTQDHSRNFDFMQLEQKLSVAVEINKIFEDNSDLDQGHRRRDLIDAEGVDRVNPRSWQGDLDVHNVDLVKEWLNGRSDAIKLLKNHLKLNFNFSETFCRQSQPSHDFLRPRGTYVGTSLSADDVEDHHAVPTDEIEAGDGLDLEEDLDNVIADEEIQPDIVTVNDTETAHEPEVTVLPKKPSKFITIDGKEFFKSSIVTMYLSGESTSKTIIRPLRAQGLSAAAAIRRIGPSEKEPDHTDLVKIGDLVASLVYSKDILTLALIEVIAFDVKGQKKCTSYQAGDLGQKSASEVTIRGQPIVIKPRSIAITNSEPSTLSWVWNHQYATFWSAKSKSKKPRDPRQEKLLVSISGRMVLPVSRSSLHDVLVGIGAVVTWEFSEKHLSELTKLIIEELKTYGAAASRSDLGQIPDLGDCEHLPYLNADGCPSFNVEDGLTGLSKQTKLRATTKISCKVCSESDIRLDNMREHVGRHILHAFRGTVDPSGILGKIGLNPCGWCGLEGCITRMVTKKRGGLQIVSNCPYHYERMVYENAKEHSPDSPCTNVPVKCLLCPTLDTTGELPTIWKYNAWAHLATEHADPADEMNLPDVPDKFLIDIFVSKKEEEELGISEEQTTAYREQFEIQNSSDVEELGQSLKRGRGESDATVKPSRIRRRKDVDYD
ncbi:hypothetical protein H0H93_013480 [Arthromyces matolae]|nr:hypothetical protein H0H93_013480 [Arthromyces matolae]